MFLFGERLGLQAAAERNDAKYGAEKYVFCPLRVSIPIFFGLDAGSFYFLKNLAGDIFFILILNK